MTKGVVKVIPVKGFIITKGSMPISQIASEVTYSDDITRVIRGLESDEETKAVIFEINSPGGMPYASKEIGEAIKRLEEPTIALIKEYGTSGAYWIASTCNKIVADSLSGIDKAIEIAYKLVGEELRVDHIGRTPLA